MTAAGSHNREPYIAPPGFTYYERTAPATASCTERKDPTSRTTAHNTGETPLTESHREKPRPGRKLPLFLFRRHGNRGFRGGCPAHSLRHAPLTAS